MGGVPYRPAGLEWPRSEKTGNNYGMVAQFRFTESKDILPDLPGDVLLCFLEEPNPVAYDDFGEPPIFEWYPLGLSDLIKQEDVPEANFEMPPACYGLRYRTVDYADHAAVNMIKHVLPEYLYDRLDCDETDRHVRGYTELGGLKIGGIPYWEFPDEVREDNVEPGPFIASFPGVCGKSEDKSPWVNQESEVWFDEFRLSQGGSFRLYLDGKNCVQPLFGY